MVVPSELTVLCRRVREYYRRGWLPATSGNFSLRDEEDYFWITESGLDKGRLASKNFLRVRNKDGFVVAQQLEGQKPSAETSIHGIIYKNFLNSRAVLHVHNPEALKIRPGLTKNNPTALWTVPPTELVKALGYWVENPKVFMPVIYNYTEVDEIALTYERFYNEKGNESWIQAFLVENHGISVWGKDLDSAHRHLEALEYILRVSDYYNTGCI